MSRFITLRIDLKRMLAKRVTGICICLPRLAYSKYIYIPLGQRLSVLPYKSQSVNTPTVISVLTTDLIVVAFNS